jgi:hypothetical protein
VKLESLKSHSITTSKLSLIYGGGACQISPAGSHVYGAGTEAETKGCWDSDETDSSGTRRVNLRCDSGTGRTLVIGPLK